MLQAILIFLGGLGLVLLCAALWFALRYCTFEVKSGEAVVIKKGGAFHVQKSGKKRYIPFFHQLWRVSLIPFTVEARLPGLENQEGILFTAHARGLFRIMGDDAGLARATSIFFGRTEAQRDYTITELMHRNLAIFLPAYDRRSLEHNMAHLLNYMEDSLREDTVGLGVTMESFSLLALTEEERGERGE
jgi:hypothetical protein